MDLNKYQERIFSTKVYPHKGSNLFYPVLELSTDVGFLSGKLNDVSRSNGKISDHDLKLMCLALRRILKDTALVAAELNTDLEDIINEPD